MSREVGVFFFRFGTFFLVAQLLSVWEVELENEGGERNGTFFVAQEGLRTVELVDGSKVPLQ